MDDVINYEKLLRLHQEKKLTNVSSFPVYPGQIEFNCIPILNDWMLNFFIELSNHTMENLSMTSCDLNFYLSQNNILLCDVEAVIDSESDLFVDFNHHEIDYEEIEEWMETINMKSFFDKKKI